MRGHGTRFRRKMAETAAALLTQPNVECCLFGRYLGRHAHALAKGAGVSEGS